MELVPNQREFAVISFKGCQFPKHVILHAVYFYMHYSVSLRDLEEILAEHGVTVDHATLNRWVIKFSPMIAIEAQKQKTPDSRILADALSGSCVA